MKAYPIIEPLTDLAIAGLLRGRVASSAFWAPPSQDIVWQSFITTAPVTYPYHTHPEYNIVICLRGAVEVRQCGEAQVAESGEALIGNARVPHQSVYLPDAERCEAVSLTISAAFLQEALGATLKRVKGPQAGPILLGKLRSRSIESLALLAREQLLRADHKDTLLLENLAHQLVNKVFGSRENKETYEASLTSDGAFLPRWQYVRSHEIMLDSTNDAFSIPRVARDLGVSPGRFHLLFRSSTGLSPAHYFGRIVMVKASRRLRESNDSVKEISYDLGFSSPSHFCSTFRRRYGVSPLHFRNAAQG